MKITRKDPVPIPFATISIGDVFENVGGEDNRLYIRISGVDDENYGTHWNAVDLATGFLDGFDDDDKVVRRDVELIVS